MSGFQFLDVAIGVTFFFLLLSLVVTAAVEAFENLVRMRGKYLEHGIRALLQDPQGDGAAHAFYAHPLVSGLYSTRPRSFALRFWLNLKRGRFSLSERRLPPVAAAAATTQQLPHKPSYIPADTFTDVVLDLLREAAALRGAEGRLPSALVDALDAAPLDARLKGALRPLLLEAGDDLGAARARIEAWYYAAMDRVSGWYKRYAQRVAFVIGLVMAVILNADALFVVRQIGQDEALRAVFVTAAQTYAARDAETPAPSSPDSLVARVAHNRQQMQENVAALKALGIALGWGDDNPAARRTDRPGRLDDARWWFFKGIGLLLTAIAVSLGAPFWFDVLNKVMAVRATVKPREKSLPEASDDPQPAAEKAG